MKMIVSGYPGGMVKASTPLGLVYFATSVWIASFFLVKASSAVTVLVDYREHDVCLGVDGIAAAAEDATDDCDDC